MSIAALAILSGCGGGNPVRTTEPSGTIIPSIGGTYQSSTMWRFELTRSSDNQASAFDCAGSLTVGSQLASTFSGTFQVNDQSCGGTIGGTVTSGTLGSDGAVSFGLAVQGTDPNFLTAAFGCTYVSGDTRFTGTIIGNQLQAAAAITMDCPVGGRFALTTRLSGSR